MPIKIPNKLPAKKILERENIFVMTEKRAIKQDIRPLKLLILNLMPTKIETETQLLRLLGNTPLQVEIEFIKTETYSPKNTSEDHLSMFYKTFSEIKGNKYDGMIITGAPLENMEYEEVAYWQELCDIMDWSETHAFSTMHICWGAFAGLYHKYGIKKVMLDKKLFGIFKHQNVAKKHMLMRGFDDYFLAPHSRHMTINENEVKKCKELKILARSDEVGVYIASDKKGKNIYITGHSEYDATTLLNEYNRDVAGGKPIELPTNYLINNDPISTPPLMWRAHANLLFNNWLNYFVYQSTPFNIDDI